MQDFKLIFYAMRKDGGGEAQLPRSAIAIGRSEK
jgi:hypothetical protein